MAATIESLGLGGLTPDERLALAGELWNSVLGSKPPGALLTDAQREELRKRAAHAEAHPEDSVAWEDVQAEMHKRLSK
jgi:putative addiction module component (TIGR02574 family)